jgi:hypothetical protein
MGSFPIHDFMKRIEEEESPDSMKGKTPMPKILNMWKNMISTGGYLAKVSFLCRIFEEFFFANHHLLSGGFFSCERLPGCCGVCSSINLCFLATRWLSGRSFSPFPFFIASLSLFI